MTDSIKVKLDLFKVPKAELKQLFTPHVSRADPRRPTYVIPFAAKQSWKSPLTLNKMQIKVLVDQQGDPVALVSDINIPNATVGQNAELGHSVYAACTVGLGLLKIFLAQHHVPKKYLDLLTVADLGLGSGTITYLLPVPEDRTAQGMIEAIEHRFTQFFPLSDDGRYGGYGVGSKGSRTAYCKMRGWYVCVYSTPASKIPGDDEDVRKDRIRFAQKMVRIELTLTLEELRKYGLHEVSAWKDAHAAGIYKMLFDTYIRNGSLRLNEHLRQDKPDATDLKKLSDTNRHIVEGYLENKPLDNCQMLQRHSKVATQKARSAARLKILKQLRIDIDIEWVEHRKLGNRWMDKVIVYPGDHHPPADRVEDAVCRDNLPAINQQLQATLERAARPVHGGATVYLAPDDDGVIAV